MKIDRKTFWKNSWWLKLFLVAIAVGAVYKAFDNLGMLFGWIGFFFKLLTPFVAGFVFAYLLHKPVYLLERKFSRSRKEFIAKRSLSVSVFVVYAVFLLFLALILIVLIPALVQSVIRFIEKAPDYLNELKNFALSLYERGGIFQLINIPALLEGWSADNLIQNIDLSDLQPYAQGVIDVTSMVGNICFGAIISVYMLLERKSLLAVLQNFLALFISREKIQLMCDYSGRVNAIVYHYFFGQFLDSLLVSILSSIALAIIGVPSPMAMGFLFGMFNLIPYFGPIISGVLVVGLTFLSSGWGGALTTAITLLIIQQIDANIINPRILGNQLGMSPFWVICALTLGGGIFGLWGILLGVPFAAVIRQIVRDFYLYRHRKKKGDLTPVTEASVGGSGKNR